MCGVVGVALPPGSGTEAAAVASTGLFALQHRGQESAGLAVSDGAEIFLYKDLGMIAQVLDDRRLPSFRGDLAIARRGPRRNVGWAFSHTDEPVVE